MDPPFNKLSDELKLKVFGMLASSYPSPLHASASLGLVCQEWHRLAGDRTFWGNVDVSSRALGPINPGFYDVLLERAPKVSCLNLSGQTIDDRLFAVLEACSGLKVLNLSRVKCECFRLPKLPMLEELYLTSLPKKAAPNLVDIIVDAAPALKCLQVESCNVTDVSRLAILALHALNLNGNWNLDAATLVPVLKASVASLRHLHLSSVPAGWFEETCSDLTLESLDVSNSVEVSSDTVSAIAQHLGEHLKNLNLQNTAVRDEGIIALSVHCVALEDLNVSNTSLRDDALNALFLQCGPRLRRLNVGNNRRVTDEGFASLMDTTRPLLEEVNVGGCGNLTDTLLEGIGACAPNLRVLNLNRCIQVFQGLKKIAKGCPKLEHLYLHDLLNIRDDDMRAIADGCPSLTSINLSGCKHVTRAGFVSLLDRECALEVLTAETTGRRISEADLQYIKEVAESRGIRVDLPSDGQGWPTEMADLAARFSAMNADVK